MSTLKNRPSFDLELDIEKLERKILLAADFAVTGSTLKITGDEMNDFVAVEEQAGEIVVQLSEEGAFESTGLASVDRLIIKTGAGDDLVNVSIDTNRKMTINLGAGNDEGVLGGEHARLTAIGGQGDDTIVMAGALADRARVATGAGNDLVQIDFSDYLTTFAGSLSDLKFTFAMGGGDDDFQLTNDGEVLNEENVVDLGLDAESVAELLDLFEGFGLGDVLSGFKVIGGGGVDTTHGTGVFELITGLGGKVKSFEDTTGVIVAV